MNIPVTHQTTYGTIYIFKRNCRASDYGIGTYVKELTSVLKDMTYNIVIICLESDRLEFSVEELDNIQHWHIPLSSYFWSSGKSYNEYYKKIVALIRLYIRDTDKFIFHFNSMRDYQLAEYLREFFNCKILLIVHYLDWSFTLQGDISRMRRILTQSKESILDSLEKKALIFFKEDRKLLKYVDHIICLTDYARDILCQDYEIESDKITVINNGVSDKSKTLSDSERTRIKSKYRIDSDEKIILCAGRLDDIKGIAYLIKAFKKVLEQEPDCRLWIIGDGAYNPLFQEGESIWNKLCFTGRIRQEQLYELYSITDIGVIPSLFEPFGYVAIEMMMHSLPLVVTATGGLDEIVEEGISGFKISLEKHEEGLFVNTEVLTARILYLLQNPVERIRLGRNGRKHFLEKYTTALMGEKTADCYQKLILSFSEKELYPVELK